MNDMPEAGIAMNDRMDHAWLRAAEVPNCWALSRRERAGKTFVELEAMRSTDSGNFFVSVIPDRQDPPQTCSSVVLSLRKWVFDADGRVDHKAVLGWETGEWYKVAEGAAFPPECFMVFDTDALVSKLTGGEPE